MFRVPRQEPDECGRVLNRSHQEDDTENVASVEKHIKGGMHITGPGVSEHHFEWGRAAAGGGTNIRSEAIAGTRSITWAILAIAVRSHLFSGVNGVLQKDIFTC